MIHNSNAKFSSMSTMKSGRKPPLARSPTRLRPRRTLRSNATTTQTPPGSLAKTQIPNRYRDTDESDLRPDYRSISCELQALAKMVQDEIGNGESGNFGSANNPLSASVCSSPFVRGRFYDEYCARRNEWLKRKKSETGDVFPVRSLLERGRFYDEYSARRNEWLKRKKSETGDERKFSPYELGVTVESTKRRDSKKLESLRKSATASFSVDRRETPRYMLRSSTKENKKPPLAMMNVEKSAVVGGRKIGARRVQKI